MLFAVLPKRSALQLPNSPVSHSAPSRINSFQTAESIEAELRVSKNNIKYQNPLLPMFIFNLPVEKQNEKVLRLLGTMTRYRTVWYSGRQPTC